jgi:hypothetical protein
MNGIHQMNVSLTWDRMGESQAVHGLITLASLIARGDEQVR